MIRKFGIICVKKLVRECRYTKENMYDERFKARYEKKSKISLHYKRTKFNTEDKLVLLVAISEKVCKFMDRK